MTWMKRLLALICPLVFVPASTSHAQTAGYVVMLGKDTIQVEMFTRTKNRVEGTVAYRAPVTRVVKYALTLDASGEPLRYEQSVYKADGTPVKPHISNATLAFTHDSVVVDTWKGADAVSLRLPLKAPSMPLIGASYDIPFQYSYMTYELAYAQAVRGADAFVAGAAAATPPVSVTPGESRWYLASSLPTQKGPQAGRVWIVGKDSLEVDYFGVARSGYKFDASRHLLRTNWTKTTYAYLGSRVKSVDVDAVAKRWAAQEAAGNALGRYSPRDSSTVTMGGATLSLGYGRPAMRGREIWGGLVPNDKVWRLGADYATHMVTDVDLDVGGVTVPAGKYSIWMLMSQTAPMLVVNKQTGHFGTQYDPRQDLVRIPLQRVTAKTPVERLTLSFRDDAFWIEWGDAAFTAAVRKH